MTRRIVFRCDGATLPEIGTGHVVRAVTLARALARNLDLTPDNIVFATRNDGHYAIGHRTVKRSGFPVAGSDAETLTPNSVAERKWLAETGADLIVMDRLKTDAKLVRGLKDAGGK